MNNFQESDFLHQNPMPDVVKQRYTIERKIGEGGFAETFLAHDQKAGTRCVLKVLTWKNVPDWKIIEMFEREARVLSNMTHPQIPRFIEFFTDETGPSTRIILVQEYIEGKNLAESIKEGRHYTEQEVVQIALQTMPILEYLHNFSPPIIHRDIKPSNLLQSQDGELHLIDFGAVRDKVLHHQKTEAAGFTVVGTYGFMPFEQFQGQAVPASDIYSLGMTLITLLSHKEPHEMQFTGSDVEFEPYVNISANFRSVLKKMIAHRHEDRYSTAKELREDLEALLAGNVPKAIQRKTRRISTGSVVLVLLLLFVGWFALVRKQPVRQQQRQTGSAPAVPAKPALKPPYTGKLVRGNIEFDCKTITVRTSMRPTFWFRDETSGKQTSAEVVYSDGQFEIHGLTPGVYGVSVQLDTNPRNPISYPGDLRAWETFTVVQDADTSVKISPLEIIHIIKPEDNGLVLRHWNRCCEEGKPSHRGALDIAWKSLGENVFYDYTISRLICPYKTVESVASGTTPKTRISLNLPPSQANEYYLMQLYARRGGVQIGMLMTHGANGFGWDYRFRTN